jgi:Co/Zn/Cd efflux system component
MGAGFSSGRLVYLSDYSQAMHRGAVVPPTGSDKTHELSTASPSAAAAIPELRRLVRIVALANLIYFGIEFATATTIGSVSLFADSIDFLEDAAVNGLILIGLGWAPRARARLGMALTAVLLVPGVATLWTAWQAWNSSNVPAPTALTLVGLGALIVNLACALLLAKVRHVRGSLTRAAFLSARNDVIGNVAIVIAGGLTAATRSPSPDLIVGLGIFLMNLNAAREVFLAARSEHRSASNICP